MWSPPPCPKPATWNNTTIIAGDVVTEVRALTERYDGDILVGGSATLVGFLHRHGLIDEFRLMLHPVILGHGTRLFPEGTPADDLTLVTTIQAGPNVPLLIYRPAGK